MPPSYTSINYTLRPAKHIERKMIVEGLSLLADLQPLRRFRYVGFGSIYFSDFRLVHKNLGIKSLVSIEKEERDKPRFEFNRPYRCIHLEFGHSSEVLPKLTWSQPTVLWLDYDGKINPDMLADIRTFIIRAVAPSVVVITLNVDTKDEDPVKFLKRLRKKIGRERVPAVSDLHELQGWGAARFHHKLFSNEIADQLAHRNGALDAADRFSFKQLFNFNYADGAKMMSMGGLIYGPEHAPVVNSWKLDELPFLRDGDAPFLIDVPLLTYKEMRALDQLLPKQEADASRGVEGGPQLKGVPEIDVDKYATLYRYFPAFADADL